MATPKHLRIVFRGIFESTPEEWSFSTKWRRVTTAAPDAGTGDVDKAAVKTALDTYLGAGHFQSNVIATDFRIYPIGSNGLVEGNPHIEEIALGDNVKGSTTVRYPPQIALVVTTVADNRGPAKLGRFFLPGPGVGLGADVRVSQAEVNSILTETVAFLKGVSDAIDLPGTVESAAMQNISSVGAGVAQDVDHIRLGRVLDTVRSRRRSMLEEYTEGGQIDW